MEDISEKRLSGEELYRGILVRVHMDRAELCDGRIVKREVVEHADGVAVLPVDRDGNCWLVRQFRYPFGKILLEVPAGKLEKGEDPAEAALRELSEETGLKAKKLIHLGNMLPSPGYATEVLHLYLAQELEEGDAHPDDGEYLRVEKMPFTELCAMVENGAVEDAKTALAVCLSKPRL